MAKNTLQEIVSLDNDQSPKEMLKSLRSVTWSAGDDLRDLADKVSLLGDVDFTELSHRGTNGMSRYLREMSAELEALSDKLQNACKSGSEVINK